jgi:hypothetical protein
MTQMTIRDLALLTLIVALAVGWWVDHTRMSRQLEVQHRTHVKHLNELQGTILMQESFIRTLDPNWRTKFRLQ